VNAKGNDWSGVIERHFKWPVPSGSHSVPSFFPVERAVR
jgi:hypothetical protein